MNAELFMYSLLGVLGGVLVGVLGLHLWEYARVPKLFRIRKRKPFEYYFRLYRTEVWDDLGIPLGKKAIYSRRIADGAITASKIVSGAIWDKKELEVHGTQFVGKEVRITWNNSATRGVVKSLTATPGWVSLELSDWEGTDKERYVNLNNANVIEVINEGVEV